MRTFATSTTPSSSVSDPAEEEAQRVLEEGTTALEAGDVAIAEAAYLRSLSIKETASARFNLGVCFYMKRDIPAAIKAWDRSLELEPDSADAHTNLASAYVLSKPARPDKAVSHLKSAQALAPSDPEIAFNLGAVLEACDQLEDALVEYGKAVQGGIERAEQNVRNVTAKLVGAKARSDAEAISMGEEPGKSEFENEETLKKAAEEATEAAAREADALKDKK